MTKRRSIGSIVGYLILSFILLIAVILFILYLGILDLEKRERGFVELPNNYGVFQVSIDGPYEIAVLNNDDKQVVKPNILELGWDERYVLYKRKDGITEEVGVLDTKTKKVKNLSYSTDNIQKLKSEFGIAQNIALKSVFSLWPDVSKMR